MAQVVITGYTTDGDAVTVSGTVDGTPATVTVWASHLVTLSTVALKRIYCANQLKVAVPPLSVPNTTLNGTLTV